MFEDLIVRGLDLIRSEFNGMLRTDRNKIWKFTPLIHPVINIEKWGRFEVVNVTLDISVGTSALVKGLECEAGEVIRVHEIQAEATTAGKRLGMSLRGNEVEFNNAATVKTYVELYPLELRQGDYVGVFGTADPADSAIGFHAVIQRQITIT